MAKPAYYQVKETFVGELDGEPVEYYKGEAVETDDPALGKWPDYFEPLVLRHSRPAIEQATAAPGEKRGA